ncbi:MAG: glycerophosphodiester phosphodiesterase [Butyricicoccus sp.]
MKKGAKIAIGILGGLVLTYAVIAFLPRPDNYKNSNPLIVDGDTPVLIAHGGGNGEFPDNTLEAFYNAYSVDENVMMETDVSITKDGVVILSHDTTLDRKTNVTGAIADWNYSDLISQRVDFGYTNPTVDEVLSGEREHFKGEDGEEKYPTDVSYPAGVEPRDEEIFFATTLEELLVTFPDNYINVEIKQSGELGLTALDEVLRLLYEYDAFDRVVLASFHEEIYDRFCELATSGDVPDNFMFSPAYDSTTKFFVLQLFKLDVFFTEKMCVFQLPTEEYGINLATKAITKCANRHNLAVHYWTINEPDEMRHLIDIGADGIMTDYPHRLKTVLDEYCE